jgi:hypothetical protein
MSLDACYVTHLWKDIKESLTNYNICTLNFQAGQPFSYKPSYISWHLSGYNNIYIQHFGHYPPRLTLTQQRFHLLSRRQILMASVRQGKSQHVQWPMREEWMMPVPKTLLLQCGNPMKLIMSKVIKTNCCTIKNIQKWSTFSFSEYMSSFQVNSWAIKCV